MGSKGRLPPLHMRHPLHHHPLPGPGLLHPEPPFGAGMRPPLPPPGAGIFPPMDMLPLPPPEILEQKLAAQHGEMERLATENQRLAATHGTLRQQLAAAQQELQMLESHIQGAKAEREQLRRELVERISKMEVALQSADRLKLDLQQARTEAQSLVEVRQELIAKVKLVNDELQRTLVDVQQLPMLLSELNNLRQEFHQCRATYEHERKVYRDHVESLQGMDKEYKSMADEVARLRAELANKANSDKKPAYSSGGGYGEADPSAHNSAAQGAYQNSYGAQQVHASSAPVPVAAGAGVAVSTGGTPTYAAPQSGTANARVGYDASKASGYDPQRGPAHPAYGPQGGQFYNAPRLPGYSAYMGVNYDPQRPPPYDPQRAAAYEIPQPTNYNASFIGAAPPPLPGQPPANIPPYASAAAPAAQTGLGNEAQSRAGNAPRR